jgi:hypothetical protein
LLTDSVIGCRPYEICALFAGAVGLGAMIVTPVRASVTDSGATEVLSTLLGRVGLAFSHATVTARNERAPKRVVDLKIMCSYQ